MRKSLGGLLCILLGAVLIATGAAGTSQVAGGGVQLPTCNLVVGVAAPCPQGTISVTETTTGPLAAPASWSVTITSPNCTDPSGNTINQTLTVPNGATATSASFFVYTSPAHSTTCSYELTETAVAGFTPTFAPASPETLPFNGGSSGNDLSVRLTNASVAATTSVPPSTSTAPTTTSASGSVPASDTGSAGSGSTGTSGSAAGAAGSSPESAQPLAATGTRTSIAPSVYAGIALCLLGLFLIVAARRRKPGAHHT